jgi:IPT/TIG domain
LGGTNVNIFGPGKSSTALDFADATGVNFCTTGTPVTCTPAASFQIGSNNTLSAVTPALSGGLNGQSSETMNVEVTNLSGTSVANPADDSFQYNETPTVTSVTTPLLPGEPAAGPANCALPCATSVTITGSGFTGIGAAIAAGTGGVFFGGINAQDEATGVTFVSDSEITAVAPIESAGSQHVKVENAFNGVSLVSQISPADLFTYDNPPTITGISPASGNGPTTVTIHGNPVSEPGTTVTLKGTGFSDVNQVAFCQTTCTPALSFATVSDKTMTAVVPSVSSSGAAYVQLSYGASATCGSSADPCGSVSTFTFEPLPVVTGVSTCNAGAGACGCAPGTGPAGGSVAGGDTVVVQGVNFNDGLGDDVVTIGGSAATGVDVCSNTEIMATTPPGSAGDAEVQVSTFAGTVTSPPNPPATSFYYDYLPTVSSVSPNGGQSGGGTVVDITGTGFADQTGVFFCTTSAPVNCSAATAVTASSASPDTSLLATAPKGTGVADVEVINEDGTSATSTADQFTYGPVVASVSTAVSPVASGPVTGGTLVTVAGTGFTGATSVSFCPVSSCTAQNIVSVNNPSVNSNGTQITVVSPPDTAGAVDVTVTTPDGTSLTNNSDEFDYDGTPTVTSIVTPSSTIASGPERSTSTPVNSGETQVTIGGTGLADATGVSFCTSSGCTPAVSFAVNSDASIMATSPPIPVGLAGTDVTDDVEVTNPTGTSPTSPSDHFIYDAPPQVGSITPTAGAAGANTTVTVYGSGFADATEVQFAQPSGSVFVPQSAITFVSDTQISVPAPLSLVGTFNVKVINPNGTSLPVSADKYTFDNPPMVSAVSPAGGLPAGGTSVTITGTGLADVTGVSIGGNPAPISSSSDTSITVTSPPSSLSGSLGPVPVVLTYPTPSGSTGSFTSAIGFTYANTATVTGISPSSGSSAGGMTVVITGTGFLNASAVVFGSTNAQFTPNQGSDSSLTVTVPAGSVGTVHVRVTNPIGISKSSSAGQFTYT